MEPNKRFPDSRIFCRLDIAVRAMLQTVPPSECPQTEAGGTPGKRYEDSLRNRESPSQVQGRSHFTIVARFWINSNSLRTGTDLHRATTRHSAAATGARPHGPHFRFDSVESRNPPNSGERLQKIGDFQFAASQHGLAVAEQQNVKVVIEQFRQRSFKLRGVIELGLRN